MQDKQAEYPRVKVTGHPGWDDFEGDLIMEIPSIDGRMMSVVGWDRSDPNGFDVFMSEHVTRLEGK